MLPEEVEEEARDVSQRGGWFKQVHHTLGHVQSERGHGVGGTNGARLEEIRVITDLPQLHQHIHHPHKVPP